MGKLQRIVLELANGFMKPECNPATFPWAQLNAQDAIEHKDLIMLKRKDTPYPNGTGFTRLVERRITSLTAPGQEGWSARAYTQPQNSQQAFSVVTYTAGAWVLDESGKQPDILTEYGIAQPGDLFGPHILTELRQAINPLTHRFLPGGGFHSEMWGGFGTGLFYTDGYCFDVGWRRAGHIRFNGSASSEWDNAQSLQTGGQDSRLSDTVNLAGSSQYLVNFSTGFAHYGPPIHRTMKVYARAQIPPNEQQYTGSTTFQVFDDQGLGYAHRGSYMIGEAGGAGHELTIAAPWGKDVRPNSYLPSESGGSGVRGIILKTYMATLDYAQGFAPYTAGS
ncbi:MAG TPA: hypothetical protein VGB55_02515 [Tepidisphaeraceae bacterium]|jgi:hypothetical protein